MVWILGALQRYPVPHSAAKLMTSSSTHHQKGTTSVDGGLSARGCYFFNRFAEVVLNGDSSPF